eukprot:4817961-Pleurochrysis_carterae.AAC.3
MLNAARLRRLDQREERWDKRRAHLLEVARVEVVRGAVAKVGTTKGGLERERVGETQLAPHDHAAARLLGAEHLVRATREREVGAVGEQRGEDPLGEARRVLRSLAAVGEDVGLTRVAVQAEARQVRRGGDAWRETGAAWMLSAHACAARDARGSHAQAPKYRRVEARAAALDHAALDHAALDHAALGHAALGHAALKHAALNHAALNHAALDHAALDHAALGQAALDHA